MRTVMIVDFSLKWEGSRETGIIQPGPITYGWYSVWHF